MGSAGALSLSHGGKTSVSSSDGIAGTATAADSALQ
jgi:hypothetical protein